LIWAAWVKSLIPRGAVTIPAKTEWGLHSEPEITETRLQVELTLEQDGLRVSDGEWTKATASAFLEAKSA